MTRRILIADDYPHAAATLAAFFNLQGDDVQATSASNGDEALRIALADHPDVVLIDIEMPGMSGIEVARRMRAAFDGWHALLIGMSGRPQDGVDLSGVFDELLVKPLDLDALQQRLSSP